MAYATPSQVTRITRAASSALALLGAIALAGCGSYANVDRDLDTHPIVNTGVGGTIIMPGQTGVPMANTAPHIGLAPPVPGGAAAAGPGGAPAAAGAPRSGGLTMIGSTDQKIQKHQKVNNEPAWAKAFKLPFVIAAYPFKKIHQAATGPADPTVKVSGDAPPAPPTPAQRQAMRERALLEGMAKELAGQGGPSAASGSSVAPAPSAPRVASATSTGSRSIAQELAALRQQISNPAPALRSAPESAPRSASAPAPQAAPSPAPRSDAVRLYETMDRDADGRPDRWVYRQGNLVVAEATDDDGDGRPERKVHFVPGTDTVALEEEDTNGDGRADTFTDYEGGVIHRRRADADRDGEIDAWSFYRDGQLLRHEHDTDADGFRDRMSFYDAGKLVREEEDRDGDGRPDRVTHFDAEERKARQEEDTDRDGEMDMRSFYQEGKLRRRELIQ